MKNTDELIRLVENFYEVERVVGALDKVPRSYDTEYLLYTNEVHTLKMIAQNEGINQKTLSERMLRTKGATSVMVDKLMQKGLVVRKPSEEDARIMNLFLTPEGRKVNKAHICYDEKKIGIWRESLNITDSQVRTANEVIGEFVRFCRETLI